MSSLHTHLVQSYKLKSEVTVRAVTTQQLQCDGRGAETSFHLLVEWTSTTSISAGEDTSVCYWQTEVCMSACSI